jgi:phosphohistidine phosphatase SixA
VACNEITIHGVEKSIDGLQDSSNGDAFVMSVKHGKAAEPLQRCVARHSLPIYVRQVLQDDCRELKRRGLKEVMNRSGRVLRRQLLDEKAILKSHV